MSSGFAAASNLQLLRRDALLQNFGFQLPVLGIVHTAPFEGSHVLGPEPKVLQQCVRSIRQADRMTGSSVMFHKSTKEATSSQATKNTTDQNVSVWSPYRGLSLRTRSPFVPALAGEAGTVPMCPTISRPLEQPRLQQAGVDGIQVGAHLAGYAHQWWSLLGTCWAINTVEEGVVLNFQQRPQLTHHIIAFRTRNSHQDLQQAMDALLSKGAIERVLNEASLGFYRRLSLVGICIPSSICLHWIGTW